jgi:hypothetical protein
MQKLIVGNSEYHVAYLALMARQPVREFEIDITHCEMDTYRAAHVSIADWRSPRGTAWPIRLLTEDSPSERASDWIAQGQARERLVDLASAILSDFDWLREFEYSGGHGRQGQLGGTLLDVFNGAYFNLMVSTVQIPDGTWMTTINCRPSA